MARDRGRHCALILEWVAPGDDFECGTVTAYDVRVFTAPFNESEWETGQRVPFDHLPRPAWEQDVLQVSDLQPDTTYYFGVRAIDDAGNMGSLSNVASARTLTYGGPELVYLRTSPDPQEVFGTVTIAAQFVEVYPISSVRIRIWTPKSLVVDEPMPLVEGEWFLQTIVADLGTHQVKVIATDEIGFVRSFSASFLVRDTTVPIADAGPNLQVPIGVTVVLDGSASSDNLAISNYTWRVTFGSEEIVLYGRDVAFVPDEVGTYLVTLTVIDGSGNADTDELIVEAVPPSEIDWVPYAVLVFVVAFLGLVTAAVLHRRRRR